MELRNETANVMNLQFGEREFTGQTQQAKQISPVIADGMGRLPPLLGQFGQISIDGDRRAHSTLLVTRASAAETISPMRSR